LPLPRFVDYSLRFIAPISLALAIYFHYQSVQERVPTYYVSPTRARIVDTSIPAPPQLQVLYKGNALNANVSAAVVYFWNDGKLPIKAEDVLEPLKIELDPACEIIDARILKVSRSVTKFAKGDVSETAKNVLPVFFGILEHNDGAQLQIIYTGKPDARVSLTGTIVGVPQPRELLVAQDAVAQDRAQKKMTHTNTIAIFILVLIAAVTLVYSFTQSLFRAVRLKSELQSKRLNAVLTIIWLLIGAGVGFFTDFGTWKSEPIPQSIRTQQR